MTSAPATSAPAAIPDSREPLAPSRDWIVFSGIVVFSLAMWWPTRTLPYHWDSAANVINAARRFLETDFHPFVPAFADFAHPPLLIGLLAFVWKLFGETALVSHLLMLPFLPLLLASTYGLGKQLANWRVGLAAAVLVGCTPFVLGEYGLIYIDLPTGALVTLAWWLWFSGKPWPSMLALTLAVLIKLPALVVLPALGLDLLCDPARRGKARSYLPLLAPPAAALVWLIYHHGVTGWWLSRPDRPSALIKNWMEFSNSSVFILDRFLLMQYRWTLLLVGFSSALFLLFRRRMVWKAELLTLAVFLGTGLLFFIVVGEYFARYAIFLMPAYAVLVSVFADQAIEPMWAKAVVLGSLATLSVLAWHPTLPRTPQYDFRFTEDLSYLDYIEIGREAAHYVEAHFPTAIVYGAFPESYQLTQPHQGYVTQAVEVRDCRDFQLIPERTQLLYVHPYSPPQVYCRQLLDQVRTQQLQLFESNGKWIELFQVVASSAGPK